MENAGVCQKELHCFDCKFSHSMRIPLMLMNMMARCKEYFLYFIWRRSCYSIWKILVHFIKQWDICYVICILILTIIIINNGWMNCWKRTKNLEQIKSNSRTNSFNAKESQIEKLNNFLKISNKWLCLLFEQNSDQNSLILQSFVGGKLGKPCHPKAWKILISSLKHKKRYNFTFYYLRPVF